MSQEIVHIITHTTDAQNRLMEQYKGEQDPENTIAAFATQIQNLEDSLFDFLLLKSLDSAVGAQLDKIGTIVGYPRDTSDDSIYRLEIKAKIVKNVSQGEAERLISVYKDMTGASLVIFQDNFPASVMLASDGSIPLTLPNANLIYDLVKSAAGAGVKVAWLEVFDPVAPFGFGGTLNRNRGFASVANPTQGGEYGHLLKRRYPFGYGVQNKQIRGFGTVSLGEPNIGGNYAGL